MGTRRGRLLPGLILSGAVLTGPAWGKHWHEDEEHWNQHAQHAHDVEDDRDFDHNHGGCYFAPHDVRIISDYYPPRYRIVPPGVKKKYYRGGHLPPGWEQRIDLLPAAVEKLLVPIPGNYRRGIIDGFGVVYNPSNGAIVDVTVLFGV